MPDTPGKRQRREVKARKRQAKDDRREAQKERRNDPEAQQLVASRDHTRSLGDADRALLSDTLRRQGRAISDRGAAQQLLHGEPHPGNVLNTKEGPRFVDLETCCRGPIEFDLARVPEDSASAIRTLTKNCSATAGCSFSRWSRRGAAVGATDCRTGKKPRENCSTSSARVHRGRRSTR